MNILTSNFFDCLGSLGKLGVIIYLTPMDDIRFANSAIPPGLSLTFTMKRMRRPSEDNPLSMQRPSTVGSMLPPHKGITTLKINMILVHNSCWININKAFSPTLESLCMNNY
jgi:hypothetical protein